MGVNMVKWGYQEGPDKFWISEFGERQSNEHLIKCALAPEKCTTDDLAIANKNAISIATY